MAKIAELKKYLGYEFSSGAYTGEDYKSFQTKYINYLKAMCRDNHWRLVNIGKNHYCFSAFIKSAQNKCVYISISDVRYFTNEWYSHILIRTAKDEQDYRGGFNHYFSLAPNGNNFSIILPHRTPMPIHISTISKPANISGWICPKRRTAFRTTSNAGMTFA